MRDSFTMRPHIVTRLVDPPMVGCVLMYMACTRPIPGARDVDAGRQLVGEWAYANLAIAEGRATLPPTPTPGSFEAEDLDEVSMVMSMLDQLRPIDGVAWNDGWYVQAGGTEIHVWMCERFARSAPDLIDREHMKTNAVQAARDAYRRYAMREIEPAGQA
jgi:hypothetical protein